MLTLFQLCESHERATLGWNKVSIGCLVVYHCFPENDRLCH